MRDLLALVATVGDLVRAASLRALKTRADTLAPSSGVLSDAATGAFSLVAFSFITCVHAMMLPGGFSCLIRQPGTVSRALYYRLNLILLDRPSGGCMGALLYACSACACWLV